VGAVTGLRWPKRNYFDELMPHSTAIPHPVDRLIEGRPAIRRAAARARMLLARIQKQARIGDVLRFEEARNAADWARGEAAYNIGFEGGLVLGRAQSLARLRRGRGADRGAADLARQLRSAIAEASPTSTDVGLVLLELAYGYAAGDAPRAAGRPVNGSRVARRRRRKRGPDRG
jgi:hypothetical protein